MKILIDSEYHGIVSTHVKRPKPQPIKKLDSVSVFPVTWHLDTRGGLAEMHRHSEAGPARQVYVSSTLPNVVKAWHLHKVQTDRFTCVRGRVLLCVCDLTAERPEVHEIIMDAVTSPVLVTIPPLVAHGWMNIGNEESWILNCVSHEYTGADEFRRAANSGPVHGIPYNWRQSRDG